MTSHQVSEKSIFFAAIEIESPGDRAAYLDKACRGNDQLRAEVEALLLAHEREGSLLDAPAVGDATFDESAAEGPGTLIGRYKLLERIGEGGFGDVYMAEQQEPVRRKVALKIIKLGMDTRAVIARFEAERQALALMDHPNIAKVLDAGATETGRPYFVMDLVRGVPITEYCDQNNLTPSERLELFIDVCEAVQHAHQKGIIHRDLKPNNVLVTQQDGRPVPKIIDFGVAKATQQRLTEKTLFTEYRQLVGTPEYMSPEQATFGEADVDTRSDIYSLGVLLYELLVGATPFDAKQLRARGYDEICRVIRESDPPTPSKRLSTLGEAATDVSDHRHVEPTALRKLLRGDLDWIVMKCLEKDRTRRYETAHGLARDVERHLADEPVRARPPSAGYQLKKVVRKHRGPVAAGMAIAAALILGLILTAAGFLRAERERQTANSQLYVSDVNSAYHAWEEGNVDRIRHLLEQHVPQPGEDDLRGFEWRYLWGEYQRTQQIPTVKHESITGVAFSPDGTILASASSDNTVKLWDAASLTELRTLTHEAGVSCVAFSPDGSLVASGSDDQTVSLWDAATGARLAQLPQSHRVAALAFSPDGKLLAVGGGGRWIDEINIGEIKLWNVATHEEVATLSGHTLLVTTVAFSPDSKILASGGADRTIKLWNVESRREVDTLRGHTRDVTAVTFSPSGSTLASGGVDGNVKLWDTNTRKTVTEFPESLALVNCLAFSPDGATLAIGAHDSRVWLWDVATGSTTVHLTGHSRGVRSIAFAPNRTILATVGRDGTVQIADVPPLAEQTSESGHGNWLASLAVFPTDMSLLAIGCGEISAPRRGELVLWDLSTRTANTLPSKGGGRIDGVAASRDGQFLAASEFQRESLSAVLNVWDVTSGKQLWTLEGHAVHVFALAFSPDGKTLASGDWGIASAATPDTGDWGATIKLWDVATGDLRKSVFTAGFAAVSMTFSPDGRLLAIGGGKWDNGEVKLWEVQRDEGPFTLSRSNGIVSDVAFSPDGTLLAFADVRGPVTLWSVADRKQELAFNAHSSKVSCIAFSPDGKTLASGSRNGTVKLWHVATGGEFATLKTDVPVHSVRFFPDGATLAAGCMDKSAVLWHVDAEKEVLRIQTE